MKRLFVLVTRSYKYGGYCVAGFDAETKAWVRLVAGSDPSNNEIPKNIFDPFDDLDILEVETLGESPYGCQSENVVLDLNTPPVRRGKLDFSELLRPPRLARSSSLFGNLSSSLSEDEVAKQQYSLGLFPVENLRFQYAEGDDGKVRYRGSFFHRGMRYSGLTVTDPVFRKDEFAGQAIQRALVAVSLPALPYVNGKYYKFIAKIFPLTKEEAGSAVDFSSISAPHVPLFARDYPSSSKDAPARAVHFLQALAEGRDPDTNAVLDPTLLLSPSYAAWLKYAASLVPSGEPSEGRNKNSPSKDGIDRKKTYLLQEAVQKIRFHDDFVSASAIKDAVNAVREPYGKQLTAVEVGTFFENAGMIERGNGLRKRRLPTELGAEYGIVAEKRLSSRIGGTYTILFYGKKAQQFFLDNIEQCVNVLDVPLRAGEARSEEKNTSEEKSTETRSQNSSKSMGKNSEFPWTEEEDEQLKAESENGLSLYEIAKLHGRSSLTVRQRLLKLGYTQGTLETDRRWAKWLPEEDFALRQEVSNGIPIKEIVRLHGRNRSAIQARMQKLGLLQENNGGSDVGSGPFEEKNGEGPSEQ